MLNVSYRLFPHLALRVSGFAVCQWLPSVTLLYSLTCIVARSQSPPHSEGPPPDLQSQLWSRDLHHSNDNCSRSTLAMECSGGGDTSTERQESPTQGHHSGRISANSEHTSQKSSFGGPSPAQQPPMGLFMGVYQPIVGASAWEWHKNLDHTADAHGQ